MWDTIKGSINRWFSCICWYEILDVIRRHLNFRRLGQGAGKVYIYLLRKSQFYSLFDKNCGDSAAWNSKREKYLRMLIARSLKSDNQPALVLQLLLSWSPPFHPLYMSMSFSGAGLRCDEAAEAAGPIRCRNGFDALHGEGDEEEEDAAATRQSVLGILIRPGGFIVFHQPIAPGGHESQEEAIPQNCMYPFLSQITGFYLAEKCGPE